MTTYKITIKDNSIPEHMQKILANKGLLQTLEFTAIIETPSLFIINYNEIGYNGDIEREDILSKEIADYIEAMAIELDTDPESLEILSIIKQ